MPRGAFVACGLWLVGCGGTDVLELDDETRRLLSARADEVGGSGGSASVSGAGSASVLGAGSASASGAGSASVSGAGSASVSNAGSGGSAAVADDCDGFAILASKCAGVCHVSGGNFSSLTAFADDEAVAVTLVGKISEAPALRDCGLMLDPDNPTSSVIYTKSAGTQGSGCGQKMPLTGEDLTPEELSCLEGWIANL